MRYMERQKNFSKKINEWEKLWSIFTFNTAIDNEITYQISISFVSIEKLKKILKVKDNLLTLIFAKKKLKKYGIKI